MNTSGCGIRESTYRGCPSIVMESSQIAAVIVPALGGSIVSLTYKPTGKQWLVDSPSRQLRRSSYGTPFSEEAMYGWDECFPTIIECSYPVQGQYEGNRLPDHGELWSIPWKAAIQDNTLRCEGKGTALPYTLVRTLSFVNDARIRFAYELINESDECLHVLWTAHPLFAATEHTEIRLPSGLTSLLCVDGGKHFTVGRHYRWPLADDEPNRKMRFFDSIAEHDSRKFYADGPVLTGWSGLLERNTGDYLTMEWSEEQLPYFGIWINEGQYNGQLMCALEPGNGFYDSLQTACEGNKALRVEAESVVRWSFDLLLGQQ
jgi:galactose mutarotase-like enzyme